ncbi:YvrJ family protein [Paeniclostridium hominis]|uniref:YvrJ family protein n=1 Tax=Paeniclostridium hominis TaxID=2764329 RepID=UPI002FE6CA59
MQLVSNLGFPAIVTMYLLIRIEGKLEGLSTSINSLSQNIYKYLNYLMIFKNLICKINTNNTNYCNYL